MKKFAILDTGAGFLQWIGEAADTAEAVRALHKESGNWHAEDATDGDDSLVIYEVSSAEASAIQSWADTGCRSGEFPHIEGTTYTVGQVNAMLAAHA